MARDLRPQMRDRSQLLILDDENNYYCCMICKISISTRSLALQHGHDDHSDQWCARCSRLFPDSRGREQHQAYSSRHHSCPKCGMDTDFASSKLLAIHMDEVHHVCRQCHEPFADEASLEQHKIDKHYVPCFGCSQSFAKVTGLIGHVEAGKCSSGIDASNIADMMIECFYSDAFTDAWCPGRPYCCPDCHQTFSTLSSLLRHMETIRGPDRENRSRLYEMLECVRGRVVARLVGYGRGNFEDAEAV